MAVVSSDHADPELSAAGLTSGTGSAPPPRRIRTDELAEHNTHEAFWAVVDGFVVDASAFVDSHPGGLRKLLSSNDAGTGHTGRAYGFSFSRGRNAHFPKTGQTFRKGVERYLSGGDGGDGFLAPVEVKFGQHGSISILGRFQQ